MTIVPNIGCSRLSWYFVHTPSSNSIVWSFMMLAFALLIQYKSSSSSWTLWETNFILHQLHLHGRFCDSTFQFSHSTRSRGSSHSPDKLGAPLLSPSTVRLLQVIVIFDLPGKTNSKRPRDSPGSRTNSSGAAAVPVIELGLRLLHCREKKERPLVELK